MRGASETRCRVSLSLPGHTLRLRRKPLGCEGLVALEAPFQGARGVCDSGWARPAGGRLAADVGVRGRDAVPLFPCRGPGCVLEAGGAPGWSQGVGGDPVRWPVLSGSLDAGRWTHGARDMDSTWPRLCVSQACMSQAPRGPGSACPGAPSTCGHTLPHGFQGAEGWGVEFCSVSRISATSPAEVPGGFWYFVTSIMLNLLLLLIL